MRQGKDLQGILSAYLSNSKHLQHHHNLKDSWIPVSIIRKYNSMKEFTINDIVAAGMASNCIKLNDNFTALKWIGNQRGKLKKIPKSVNNNSIFKVELPPIDKQTIKIMFKDYGNVKFIDQHVDSNIAYVHLEIMENPNQMQTNPVFDLLESFTNSYPSFKINLLDFSAKESYLSSYRSRNNKKVKKKRSKTTNKNIMGIKKKGEPLPDIQFNSIVAGLNKL
eukprot:NODE_596_length_6276_cov_0.384977.p3 type:complete len:222 gc:universal NODE_596_length_6276_cov_0.384977:4955-5620(+)